MTTLKEYLFYKEISITNFAKQIGACRHYVNQIVLGRKRPSKFLAKVIEDETHGEVKAEDLLRKN